MQTIVHLSMEFDAGIGQTPRPPTMYIRKECTTVLSKLYSQNIDTVFLEFDTKGLILVMLSFLCKAGHGVASQPHNPGHILQ